MVVCGCVGGMCGCVCVWCVGVCVCACVFFSLVVLWEKIGHEKLQVNSNILQ